VNVLDIDALISAAYRQFFHEQQMLKSNRQTLLESQLQGGLISVKGFVRRWQHQTHFVPGIMRLTTTWQIAALPRATGWRLLTGFAKPLGQLPLG
jgi:hypothetical protein